MSTSTSPIQARQASIVVGPVAAAVVAWALSLPGDRADSGVTLANVALVMAVVTVGFATLDWMAGVTTSVVAALTLNFFHTEPYHTLRITDRRDVYSVVLLGLLGLAVSAVTAIRVRHGVTELRHVDARRASDELVGLLAHDHPVPEVWTSSIGAAANDLGLVMARLERFAPDGLPQIGRMVDDPSTITVTLPGAGAALRLTHRFDAGRWLVLTPREGMAPVDVDRRAVLAFADALELALEPDRPFTAA